MITPSQHPFDTDNCTDHERLIAAHTAACHFYRDQLLHTPGPRRYLVQRGFTAVTTAQHQPWQVGYALPDPIALTTHLNAAGYRTAELITAGLTVRGRHGQLVDAFRDRILFPYHNHHGQPVAFIGRAAPGTRTAKYRNSASSPIYRKGSLLFGLAEQHEHVKAGQPLVLVEGPFDVIAVWLSNHDTGRHRTPMAVGTCGIQLTTEQITVLAALSAAQRHGITTAYDNDAAGQRATKRAWHLLHSSRLPLSAAELPAGSDPADFAANGQLGALRNSLTSPRPLIQVILDLHLADLLERHPRLLHHVDGRIAAARFLVHQIRPALPQLSQSHIVAVLNHLSTITGNGLDTILSTLIDALEC